jgi:TRAP-type mannitol/chloroaromatic compound transport system permease small subunit
MSEPRTQPSSAAGGQPDQDDLLELVVHHTALPDTAVSHAIDALIRKVGDAISWLWLLLVAVIVLNVVMRYAFGEGRVEFEEIQWHIYSLGFLIGLSYCLEADDHVRIDLFHDRFSLETQAWIELIGTLVFLAPFIAIVIVYAWPFVTYSFAINEISEAPGGLPMRWLIKSALIGGFVLLALAMVSRLLRVTALLFGVPAPIRAPAARPE